MNVIFLDFDGVIAGLHDYLDNDYNRVDESMRKANIEKRIKILGDICKKYDCKVVIESSHKDFIDEETLETDVDWIQDVLNLFKKYDIDFIGRTPTVKKYSSFGGYYPIWKEYEIRVYLFRHPEIDHYVVIDDDDRKAMHMHPSDLDKVRNHLVETEDYNKEHPEKEGLLEKHIDEVGEKIKLENEIKKFALRRKSQES